jgi:DNA-binding GntR family transcriptional regulator
VTWVVSRPVARAAEEAQATLRAAILSGEIAPGARLGEVELAEQLGVSRTPVREALRRLAADGLVEVLPNRGARVAQWTPADLDEIYELRALLESHGASRAATRIDAAEVDVLAKLCDDMEACVRRGRKRDLDHITALNAEFHQRILDSAGSPRLTALVPTVVQVPLVARTFHLYSPDALARSLGHHRELVAAMRAADPAWAGSVMRSHVLAARAVLLGPAAEPAEGR